MFVLELRRREVNKVMGKTQLNRIRHLRKVYVQLNSVVNIYNNIFGWKLFFAFACGFMSFLQVTNYIAIMFLTANVIGKYLVIFISSTTISVLVSNPVRVHVSSRTVSESAKAILVYSRLWKTH